MATEQQTKANRQNARSSTGPRTAAGKARSSQNALKHGLRAQAPVLPDENPDDFEFLVSELENQFQPQTALEWTLLRQLADAEWRMRRVPQLEAALFAANINESVRYYDNFPERLPEDDSEADLVILGAAAERDAANGDTLSKLSRYEARLSHRYFKALDHLNQLQNRRKTNPRSAGPTGDEAPTRQTNPIAGLPQMTPASNAEPPVEAKLAPAPKLEKIGPPAGEIDQTRRSQTTKKIQAQPPAVTNHPNGAKRTQFQTFTRRAISLLSSVEVRLKAKPSPGYTLFGEA